MTAEQIHAMEAGPETDLLVREIVEAAPPLAEPPVGFWAWDAFRPSRDWNSAMFAAERFGLFDEAERSLQLWRVGWVVCRELPEGLRLRDRIVGCANNGPLAICRAILLLNLSRKSASSD